MSAINTFAFQNVIGFSRTRRACAWVFAEQTLQPTQEPVVTARWTVETDQNGARRLVRHWFSNEAARESVADNRSAR